MHGLVERGQFPAGAGEQRQLRQRLRAQQQRRHHRPEQRHTTATRATPPGIRSRRACTTSATAAPNDVHYDVIDQTTGEITSDGRNAVPRRLQPSPAPIRLSTDGAADPARQRRHLRAHRGLRTRPRSARRSRTRSGRGNLLVDVDSTDLVEIRDASSHAVLHTLSIPRARSRCACCSGRPRLT